MEELAKGKNCIADNIEKLKYFIPKEIHMLRQAKRVLINNIFSLNLYFLGEQNLPFSWGTA